MPRQMPRLRLSIRMLHLPDRLAVIGEQCLLEARRAVRLDGIEKSPLATVNAPRSNVSWCVSFRQACKIRPPRAGLGRRPMGVRVANGSARGGTARWRGEAGPVGRW